MKSSFKGTKTVKDFLFDQVYETDITRVYKVITPEGSTHFEVFRKKFNSFGEEIYPNDNDFGVTAYTTLTFENALEKVDFFSSYNIDNQECLKTENV